MNRANGHDPGGDTTGRRVEAGVWQDRLLLSVGEIAQLLGVSTRTIWRKCADPSTNFPRPRQLDGRTVWLRREIEEFVEELPRAR